MVTTSCLVMILTHSFRRLQLAWASDSEANARICSNRFLKSSQHQHQQQQLSLLWFAVFCLKCCCGPLVLRKKKKKEQKCRLKSADGVVGFLSTAGQSAFCTQTFTVTGFRYTSYWFQCSPPDRRLLQRAESILQKHDDRITAFEWAGSSVFDSLHLSLTFWILLLCASSHIQLPHNYLSSQRGK